ncbi:protein ROS1C-like [Hordeum vulgare subsp. vulgare]|uniref:protein ROS1C-like n=1 Tax=Hordeum vulgare subsp. vulgare TaxID=112509 RepID=UPI000B479FC6|nr:protein ROS1C-like [Hordeum vulgare subsp. vulgare]XP_044978763.1 protein ROS1C-like [Hordeum vulgare subsp. vulgare]XP_044978764.1 protein ROS1C-like [Hordeum vulgare subsp. vulgare]
MEPSGLNPPANPAMNQENWTPGMWVESGAPSLPGNLPLFPQGDGAPAMGWPNLAASAVAPGISHTTAMLNAMRGGSTPTSGPAAQDAGSSVRPPNNLPAGCTQVPISILVFHRRTSRPLPPAPHTSTPVPALPGVAHDSEDDASIQFARRDFLSLGRESDVAAIDPSTLAVPVNCSSEHPPIHLQANGLDAEAPRNGIQPDDRQQSSSSSAGVIDQNMQTGQQTREKLKTQSQLNDHTVLSAAAAFKESTVTQIEVQISSPEKFGTFQNEEAPARKVKPRRKKHRAKVIREDKKIKKQKPAVTTPEGKSNQKAKRSYVRKKRNLSSMENCSGPVSNQSGEAENAAGSRAASVRRRLELEFGEHGVLGDRSSAANPSHHIEEKHIHAKSSFCSTATVSTVQGAHGLHVDIENSPGGLAFGMSRKMNKLLDEYIHLPEMATNCTQEVLPVASGCFSREPRRKQDSVGSTHGLDATRIGVTITEGNNKESNRAGFAMHHSATSVPETASAESQMTKVSRLQKRKHQQCRESESSLAGSRQSIILSTAAQMLAFCQAGGIKKKRTVRVRRTSYIPIMNFEMNSAQVLPRLSQSCLEALNGSPGFKFYTKKRSRRVRRHYCRSEGTFQSPNNGKIYQDIYCEATEKGSQNSQYTSTPYMDFLRRVASGLKYLDLNTEPVHINEMYPSLTTSAIVPFGQAGSLSNSLVPFGSQMIFAYERPLDLVKKQRPRAKVDLDFETTRVWNLLMGKATDEPVDVNDVEKERWWQREREVFQGRANSFVARMRLVQGDRHFSPWKGSVVDSVVGVFLTQNVSDHLSSSAYMALVASFPPGPVNSNCKDDIISQDYEEIISTSVVGGINMSDCFDNGARPDLRENFEELSTTNEKIPVETKDCASAYELIKGENYSFFSKEPNEDFCKHQETEPNEDFCNPKAQQFPDFSIELITSERSSRAIQFQKDMSSSQSVIISEVLQSRLFSSSGKKYSPKNSVGSIDGAASQQLGSNFDGENSLAGNDASTKELECQRIKTTAVNDDGASQHGIPSTSMMNYPFISVDHQQLGVTNESYVLPTSPNSSSGSAPSHLKNGKNEKKLPLSGPFDNHTAQTNYSETVISTVNAPKTSTDLPVNRTSFEAPDFHEHESLSVTGGTIAETANRVDESTVKSGFPSYNEGPDKAEEAARPKKTRTTRTKNAENFDWDKFRRQACADGHMKERKSERRDSVDWEAVRCADVHRISQAIRERGMNNVLADRIQKFLNRLVRDHGSIDLEWLRDIPPESAKDYLLSIRGLGLKSVECVRLLTLHHLAFPVDTNVGRICVRLGWVPIQPLPESLQLHLLELYPVLATIQKYLWPRLCKLDQKTLYELHYHMITFGKVFCTKSKPNCNACPMRSECRHFASAFASARLALPAPQEKSLVRSSNQFTSQSGGMPTPNLTVLPQLEESNQGKDFRTNNSEPIIEEPASPAQEECPETSEDDIEDYDPDTGEIPLIKLNFEAFAQNLENCIKESNMDLQSDDIAKALVAISTETPSIPVPKLKNVRRLRTEHYVYEIPDSHSLVQQLGLDQRVTGDPSPYLLTIWMQDDINAMIKAPKPCSDFPMEGGFCDNEKCQYCVLERENQSRYVRATILIPCRTAMKGSFPLNGTYFQVNEVFADHKSSHDPIYVVREQLWMLERRMVYFGTSVPSIFKGLTTEEIQQCFWKGFVCVRGFERETGSPRPLCQHLHVAASKVPRSRNAAAAAAGQNTDSSKASAS